jgi:RNA polymerase sigma-70 factor (ECF subfamily)
MEPRDFERLVDAHYQDLYRFAFSLAKNEDDACDLTQQTFVIFARKMDDVREGSKVKSWLFTTLYREFLRQGVRAKKVVSMEEADLEAHATHTSEEASRAASHSEMLDALASLDEAQRTILTLFYLDDCSYKVIAEVLGLPIGTVMSRLSRAKDSLRDCLRESPPPRE